MSNDTEDLLERAEKWQGMISLAGAIPLVRELCTEIEGLCAEVERLEAIVAETMTVKGAILAAARARHDDAEWWDIVDNKGTVYNGTVPMLKAAAQAHADRTGRLYPELAPYTVRPQVAT